MEGRQEEQKQAGSRVLGYPGDRAPKNTGCGGPVKPGRVGTQVSQEVGTNEARQEARSREKRKIPGAQPACLCHPCTPGLSWVAPFPPRCGSPPRGQGARSEPPPRWPGPSAAGGPRPRPGDLRKSQSLPPAAEAGGPGGESGEERDSLAGGARGAAAGGGGRERSGKRRGGLAGRRGRGRLGGGGDQSRRPVARGH